VNYGRRVVAGEPESAVGVYKIILFINVDDFESDRSLSLTAVLVRCFESFVIILAYWFFL